MFKKIIAALLAAGIFFSMAACSDNGANSSDKDKTKSDVEYIKEKGTLVIGITEFAPMDYKDDNGEWIGFDADMAKEIAKALDVKIQFTVIDWSKKLLELNSKSIDCAWNGMTITDEIKKGASPTNAYAKNAQVVVVKKDVADR